MSILFTSFLYAFLFVVLYFEVFLILTILENRKHKTGVLNMDAGNNAVIDAGADTAQVANSLAASPSVIPSVTIVVPIFNEEKTVAGTVHSLLALNYPTEKLRIMIVDDGSKDNTWNIVQQFRGHPQILLHKKENGGKYTALNYAIERCQTEFIGCLDADSFVDSEALNHIIPHFKDERIAAVTPSLKIHKPHTILGMMQNAEYNLGIFVRKMLGILDSQYVTPGPFSIFRRSIFDKVGMYKHAHNTEDLEMALRIQEHHFHIKNAAEALVYTAGPNTVRKLYKQRVRWTGGFIQNALDYKRLILNPKYGNFGMLVLPAAMFTTAGSFILFVYSIVRLSFTITNEIYKASLVGIHFSFGMPASDWLLYNFRSTTMFGLISVFTVTFTIWYGKKISGDKNLAVMDTIYFLVIYSLISPFWLTTSIFNTVRNRDAAWR